MSMLDFFFFLDKIIHYKSKFDFNPFLKSMYFELLYDAMQLKKVVQ